MKRIIRIIGKLYLVLCLFIIINMISRVLQVKEERRHLYYSDSINMLIKEVKELKHKVKDLREEVEELEMEQ